MSACWLRKWGQDDELAAIDESLKQNEQQLAARDSEKQWYVNGQGQTFVILDASEFVMGSPETEAGRGTNERLHRRRIGRRLAISTKEVTHRQWRVFSQANSEMRFPSDQEQLKAYIHTDDCPMIAMTWYEAAWYCNWLSQQEGIPKDQWCYETNQKGEYAAGMKAKENFFELAGYRLPTEAEWEYACRATAATSRCYGVTESLLGDYAWYQANGERRTHPVASLKPNDFGLFDMHGNVYEWCYDAYFGYPSGSNNTVADDAPSTDVIDDSSRRVLRGGAFDYPPEFVRSANRNNNQPDYRNYSPGLRPARTYNLSP